MGPTRQILVYAPINTAIVDGSAIWLQSICRVLSMMPDTVVDLLAFAPPTGLQAPPVGLRRVWSPAHSIFTRSGLPALEKGGPLGPAAACDAIAILEGLCAYDYVLVRGSEACWRIATMPGRKARLISYLTDVAHDLIWAGDEDRPEARQLRETIAATDILLCQTPALGGLIEIVAPEAGSRVATLPPMVPDAFFDTPRPPRPAGGRPRMIYAGKFATEWAIEELLAAQAALGGAASPIDLHIYGDKFNRSGDGFVDRVKPQLEAQDGFAWHGAITRDEIMARLPEFDIGYAYRQASLDASPEISTKLIEYAAAGVAPVLNRTPTHEAYFGKDYPLFANSPAALLAVLEQVAAGAIDLAAALGPVQPRLAAHRMSAVAARLAGLFARKEPLVPASAPAPAPVRSGPRRNLLITGHDLKFMGDLRDKVLHPQNWRLNEVVWPHFRGGAETETDAALQWADTIFCEWALAPAVHCAQRKRPGQKLIVRLHRFEIGTPYPGQLDIANVDALVAVSDHMAEYLAATYGWPAEKIVVIPNSIDARNLDRPKTASARFNLGVLGALPMLKRLDLALDLLEKLRSRDRRFMLHVKSKMPWDMPWIWNSPEQFRHYAQILDRIRRSHLLRGAVHLDAHGPDVARWFQKIGWILSLSDVESFHLAGVEGMASGAIPVVIDRPGAARIFPAAEVHPDLDAMAARILAQTAAEDAEAAFLAEGAAMQALAGRFDREVVMADWMQTLTALDAI